MKLSFLIAMFTAIIAVPFAATLYLSGDPASIRDWTVSVIGWLLTTGVGLALIVSLSRDM